MTSFGALDLFSGSNSLTGTNLWQADKNPLNELTEGIDDVIGKQAGGAAAGITDGFQVLINAIIGAPLTAIFGDDGAGVITDVDEFFSNLENFLTEILDAFGLEDLINGNIGGLLGELLNVPTTFINELLSLFGLGDLSGVEGQITSLAGDLFDALNQVPAELEGFVTNVEAIFGDLNFLSPDFDPEAALQAFIQDTLGGTGLIPILENGFVALENIPKDLGIDNIPLLGTLESILTDIGTLLGNPDGLGSGNPVLTDIENIPIVGPIVDAIFNAITGGDASNVTLGNLGGELAALVTSIENAVQSATNSFNVTQTFGALLHQVVADLEEIPSYQGPLDFLQNIENIVGQVWTNIVNSLSPQNPAIVQTNGQVNYLLAHLDPTTSNYRYVFDGSTLLSGPYQGPPPTTSPAFTAPTGYSLPTVPAGKNYFRDSSGPQIGVATGNPAGSATDHSVVTDRHHVEMTVYALSNGSAEFFLCGAGTTGLSQHVSLRLRYQYQAGYYNTYLSIISYAGGPMSGSNVQWTAGFDEDIKVGDVLAIEYDNLGNFEAFINGNGVGQWPDTGGLITHGPGFREIGVKSNVTNNNPAFAFGGGTGPNLGNLVAYDF